MELGELLRWSRREGQDCQEQSLVSVPSLLALSEISFSQDLLRYNAAVESGCKLENGNHRTAWQAFHLVLSCSGWLSVVCSQPVPSQPVLL